VWMLSLSNMANHHWEQYFCLGVVDCFVDVDVAGVGIENLDCSDDCSFCCCWPNANNLSTVSRPRGSMKHRSSKSRHRQHRRRRSRVRPRCWHRYSFSLLLLSRCFQRSSLPPFDPGFAETTDSLLLLLRTNRLQISCECRFRCLVVAAAAVLPNHFVSNDDSVSMAVLLGTMTSITPRSRPDATAGKSWTQLG